MCKQKFGSTLFSSRSVCFMYWIKQNHLLYYINQIVLSAAKAYRGRSQKEISGKFETARLVNYLNITEDHSPITQLSINVVFLSEATISRYALHLRYSQCSKCLQAMVNTYHQIERMIINHSNAVKNHVKLTYSNKQTYSSS